MSTICAWCGRYLRGLLGWGAASHGICKRCARDFTGTSVWDLWVDVGGEG